MIGVDMTGNEYQNLCARTMASTAFNDVNLAVAALGLTGEAGEVADHVKKYLGQGHKLDLEHLREEAGDLCWYVAMLCEVLGLSMSNIMEANIEKLKRRYPDGFSPEASQARADKVEPSRYDDGDPEHYR